MKDRFSRPPSLVIDRNLVREAVRVGSEIRIIRGVHSRRRREFRANCRKIWAKISEKLHAMIKKDKLSVRVRLREM